MPFCQIPRINTCKSEYFHTEEALVIYGVHDSRLQVVIDLKVVRQDARPSSLNKWAV